MDPKPRIFCVTDDYYFVARSEIEALNQAFSEWGMDPYDDDAPTLDECHALTEEGLDYLEIEDDDGTVRSFRDQLASELAQGREVPFSFAMRE